MLECLTHKNNGMFNQIRKVNNEITSNPQFVFINKQRYNGLVNDIKEMLQVTPYAFIKGECLSILAYGKAGVRMFSDIDILLPRQSLCSFESVLIAKGYKTDFSQLESRKKRVLCCSASHQLMPYRKTIKMLDLEIDLNFDIFWGEYTGKRIDMTSFLYDTIDIEIYGIVVKTLPPFKAMVQLILHHYKDMNSIFLLATHKSIKYDMFKDVYFLLKNNLDTITINKLYSISAEYEIIPYVYYVLYYTWKVFDDEILKRYVDVFRTSEGEALLNCYGLCSKERKEWKYNFKTRLESDNIYNLIKDDLTEKDKEKIAINKSIFLGATK